MTAAAPPIPALEYKTLGATLAAPTALNPDGNRPVVIDADDKTGIVTAVVAVTGTRDEVGDIITPGAFKSSIAMRRPKMCLGHDWNRPIGWPIDYKELPPGHPDLPAETADGKPWPAEAGGLWTRNEYMLDTEDGRNAYKHAKFYGPATAYSIGYVVTKSRKGLDDQGRPTRFIDALDLYEYGPVLHGAHPLATQQSIKSAMPQQIENKVRLVHDAHYWGLPMGTPIHPGMKPRGAKAQKLERAGHVVSDTEGAVDIPNDKLRIKPTAKGKAKFRPDGALESQLYGEIMSKLGEGEDPTDFTVDDPNGLNKGGDGEYNPLDLMVANGVTPADLEETLRGGDWDTSRLGDSADSQDEINNFVDDVVGAYREKYNAALVQQNGNKDTATVADAPDTGTDPAGVEGPTPDAPEAAPDANAPSTPEAPADQNAPQAPAPETAPAAPEATQPAAEPDKPAAPSTSTTKLTTMPKRDAAAAVAGMSDHELAGHDAEMTSRATQLGRDGQVSPNHQLVKDEVAKRATSPKPAAPAANEPAAPAAAPATAATPPPTKLRKLTPKASAAVAAAKPGTVDHRTLDDNGNIDYSGPGEPKSGLVVQGNANMVHALAKNGLAHPYSKDPNKVVLTPEGEKHHHAINGTTPPAPDGGTEAAAPSAPTMSTDKLASLDKQRAAAAVGQMSDQELAGHDQELSSRAAQLGKQGQVTPNHQAVKDEIARRPAPTPGGVMTPPTAAEGAPGAGLAPNVPGAPGEGPTANAVAAETLRTLPRDASGRVDLLNGPTALVQTLRQADANREDGGAEQDEQAFTTALDAIEQQFGQDPAMAHALTTAREFITGDVPNAKTIQRLAITDAKQFQTDAETPVGDRADAARVLASALNKSGMVYMSAPSGNIRDSRPIPNALSKYAQALISYHGSLPPAKVEKPAGAPDYTPTGDASRLGELTDSQLAAEIGSAQNKLDEIVRADPRRESGQHADAKLKLDAFQGEHSRRQQAGETHPDESAAATGGEAPNPEAPSGPSTQDGQPAETPLAGNETGIPQPAEPPHSDTVPTPQEAAQITADEQGEAQDIGDSAQGVIESDDGEFEVEPDVADRQDRIATLLGQSDAGNLDLGSQDDDQLRSTRGDIVNELKLQQYLDGRNRQRANPQPATPEPPQQNPSAAPPAEGAEPNAPQGTAAPGVPATPESAAPPQRPGVAGAAEDFADALESGDSERIDAARARLASSLRRSKTDAASVGALRDLASGESDPSAEDLRAGAQTVRAEVRERRNASARNRRTARRFERDRLRNLLHQVEGEMDRRHLRYDPVPDDGADDTTAPSAWKTDLRKYSWSNTGTEVHTLSGANFGGTVSIPVDAKNNPTKGAEYTWNTYDNDGNTITQGSGTVDNATGGRDAIITALRAQQALGNLPADAALPDTSVPQTTSARSHADIAAAVNQMHERLSAVERAVNPITGARDPLGKKPALNPPARPAFTTPDQVRQHLAAMTTNGSDTRQFISERAANVQWDNVQLTPGGGLMVVTVAGEKDPQLWHTGSGRSAMSLIYHGSGGPARLNATDLLRAGTLMESLPDDNGHTVDFSSADNQDVMRSTADYTVGGKTGVQALARNVMSALAAEKIKNGQWGHPVVKAMSSDVAPFSPGDNHTRAGYVQQNRDALNVMLGGAGRVQRVTDPHDRDTLSTAAAAQTLTNLGAPDAAAVLLRRRAAEVRATFGPDADAHGASTLDNLAAGHLSMYSPQPSPGERLLNIAQGERITVADPDGNARSYRVLSPPRTGTFPSYRTANVMDESTGEQGVLNIANTAAGNPQMTISPGADLPAMVRIDLHSPTFTVTGPDEPTPVDADAVRTASMAEVGAIPQTVLDAAANALPSSATETAARRALPADQRPPRRTSPRRAPVTAPAAHEATPVVGEQHLAATQASTLTSWVGAEHTLSDTASSGGFESLAAWRSWAKDAASDPNTPDKVQRGLTYALTGDEFLPENGAQLSPGGHMIVTRDGKIFYARAGMSLLGGINTRLAIGTDKWSPDVAMATADGIERSSWNGRTIRWGEGWAPVIDDVRAIQENLPKVDEKHFQDPLLAPTKLAVAGHVADAKTPRVADIDALESLAGPAEPNMANPEAIGGLHLRDREDAYRMMAGTRTRASYSGPSVQAQPADTKAGQSLAKRVAQEMRIAQSLAKVAPLDASRRLNRVADEIDGQKITESKGGPEHDPAAEMRKAARAIADAYDENKVTPFGKLRRAGYSGVVVPSSTPRVTAPNDSRGLPDRMRTLGEALGAGVQFSRGEDGATIARFGDQAVTTSTTPGQYTTAYAGGNGQPVQGGIAFLPDGSISMRWQDRLTKATVTTVIPSGGWDFEDPTSE